MKKKSIPVFIGIASIFGAMNLMFFILKVTSISRLTCTSFDQALYQNRYYLIGMMMSLVALYILRKKQIKNSKDESSYYTKEINE